MNQSNFTTEQKGIFRKLAKEFRKFAKRSISRSYNAERIDKERPAPITKSSPDDLHKRYELAVKKYNLIVSKDSKYGQAFSPHSLAAILLKELGFNKLADDLIGEINDLSNYKLAMESENKAAQGKASDSTYDNEIRQHYLQLKKINPALKKHPIAEKILSRMARSREIPPEQTIDDLLSSLPSTRTIVRRIEAITSDT